MFRESCGWKRNYGSIRQVRSKCRANVSGACLINRLCFIGEYFFNCNRSFVLNLVLYGFLHDIYNVAGHLFI